MHVKKCYQEAAKQQREIEEQGYRETRQEQDEWSPLKGTRSRLRIQQEGGDMLRPKMNNVKVTRSKWNVNENSERADRHGPTTRQGRSARKTKPEQTVTYKAAMEDGYNSGLFICLLKNFVYTINSTYIVEVANLFFFSLSLWSFF